MSGIALLWMHGGVLKKNIRIAWYHCLALYEVTSSLPITAIELSVQMSTYWKRKIVSVSYFVITIVLTPKHLRLSGKLQETKDYTLKTATLRQQFNFFKNICLYTTHSNACMQIYIKYVLACIKIPELTFASSVTWSELFYFCEPHFPQLQRKNKSYFKEIF